MNIDPRQIAKMITEDPDEINPLEEDANYLPQIIFLIGSLYYMAGIFSDMLKHEGHDEESYKKRQKIKEQQRQVKNQVETETQKIQRYFPGMSREEIAEKAFQTIDNNRKNEIERKVERQLELY